MESGSMDSNNAAVCVQRGKGGRHCIWRPLFGFHRNHDVILGCSPPGEEEERGETLRGLLEELWRNFVTFRRTTKKSSAPHLHRSNMADRNLSSSSSMSSHIWSIMVPKRSPGPHSNGSVDQGPADQSSRTPEEGSVSEDSSGHNKPWGQSLASVLRYRTRSTTAKNKISQEEPEALLDLILESQSQRLYDQRASLSLLPDPGPPPLCGTCSAEKSLVPSLDFYNMLIQYQSDRMEDQRCSLPHLDDVGCPVPADQENFFSLVQRVQSRRMDDQRSSMLLGHSENDQD